MRLIFLTNKPEILNSLSTFPGVTEEDRKALYVSALQGITDNTWELLYVPIMQDSSDTLKKIWNHQHGIEGNKLVESRNVGNFIACLLELERTIHKTDSLRCQADFIEKFLETAREAESKKLAILLYAD